MFLQIDLSLQKLFKNERNIFVETHNCVFELTRPKIS